MWQVFNFLIVSSFFRAFIIFLPFPTARYVPMIDLGTRVVLCWLADGDDNEVEDGDRGGDVGDAVDGRDVGQARKTSSMMLRFLEWWRASPLGWLRELTSPFTQCASKNVVRAVTYMPLYYQAVSDGVNVLSMSINGAHNATFYQDPSPSSLNRAYKEI